MVTVVAGRRRTQLPLIAGEHGNEHESIIALQEALRALDPPPLAGMGWKLLLRRQLFYKVGSQRRWTNLFPVYPGKADGTLTERAFTLQNDFLGQAAPHKPTLVALHTWNEALGRPFQAIISIRGNRA